ncbi:MAG: CRISPR system precrRNA processing endoribonuclease RAMP protein Cas6 [Thermodesulfobacteriota bacterium]
MDVEGPNIYRAPYQGLEVHRVKITLRLLEDAALPPFKGSTFRGLLGQSLLAAYCPYRAEACSRCSRAERCPYSNFFKPHLARQNKSMPTPYVIDPLPDARTYLKEGQTVGFSITVFGTAVKWVPFVMSALFDSGRKGALGGRKARFHLEEPVPPLKAADPEAWADGGLTGLRSRTAEDLARAKGLVRGVKIRTPLKLREEGEVKKTIDGQLLVRALDRRIKGLSCFYGSHPPKPTQGEWNSFPLLETGQANLRWVVLERPSRTQEQRVNIGGWVGSLEIRACNPEAEALLRLGQWIHVGKNTVCGCGKFLVQDGAR